jgi:excisionase family DNA binding protein
MDQSRQTPSTNRLSYRVADLPALTGLSSKTIRRLIAAGDLRSVRVGKAILIPHAAVEKFLDDPGEQK